MTLIMVNTVKNLFMFSRGKNSFVSESGFISVPFSQKRTLKQPTNTRTKIKQIQASKR